MNEQSTPREVAAEWFDRLWNQHDGTVIPQLMAPGARGELEGGMVTNGPEEFAQFHEVLLGTLPDVRVNIVEIVQEGEQAYVRWEAEGTHSGGAMGMVPTNRTHGFRGITWMTVRNGKIIAGGDCWNHGALMTKLSGIF